MHYLKKSITNLLRIYVEKMCVEHIFFSDKTFETLLLALKIIKHINDGIFIRVYFIKKYN